MPVRRTNHESQGIFLSHSPIHVGNRYSRFILVANDNGGGGRGEAVRYPELFVISTIGEILLADRNRPCDSLLRNVDF
jgi:hypothetical protein